jgi:hypothetical protein
VDYDKLQHAAARQQLTLLGGVLGVVTKGADVISPALVLIERNVQVPLDNGLSVELRTIANLLKQEVGEIKQRDSIAAAGKNYSVSDLMEDDGYVVRVFVRG